MVATLDLSRLVVDRGTAPSGRIVRRRNLTTRYIIPLGVLMGFAMLVVWAVRDSLIPSQAVSVVPVVVARAEVQQAGTPLFQAAGWVEPRPGPIVVSALAEGVVEQLLVVEGQEVKQGQALTRLIDIDARIALDQAQAEQRLKEAELDQARAAAVAARIHLKQPVQLTAALAESNSALARARTELKNLPYAIRTAKSRLLLARQDYEGKQSIPDAIAGRTIQRAKNEMESAQAALEELGSRRAGLEEEVAALQQRRDALAQQLELKTDETRMLAEAEALVSAADAKLSQSKLAVKAAQLRLDRMTVMAPMAGRVLSISARTGKRLMGLAPASEQDAATILTLYDPQMLQVRVDVRLEDVPRAVIGAPVQIVTASVGQSLVGEVLGVTSAADIQKNTLQVKVAIKSPPPVIKPEMLAQVTFLAPETPRNKSQRSEEPLRTLVPRDLVVTEAGASFVWIADRRLGVARKQNITLGKASTDELVEVAAGVTAMDKLIVGGREQLTDGERIRITGEDSSVGKERRTSVAAGTDSIRQ